MTDLSYDPDRREAVIPPDTPTTWGDLRIGLRWLDEEATRYLPALAVKREFERRGADLARIPVGALSKHKTHRWTGSTRRSRRAAAASRLRPGAREHDASRP